MSKIRNLVIGAARNVVEELEVRRLLTTVTSTNFVFRGDEQHIDVDFNGNNAEQVAPSEVQILNLTKSGDDTSNGVDELSIPILTIDQTTATYKVPQAPLKDGWYDLYVRSNGLDPNESHHSFSFINGDFDGDGGVSIDDFNTIAANFGKREITDSSGVRPVTFADGDADYDGGISINDFNLFSSNFGQNLPTLPTKAGEVVVSNATPDVLDVAWGPSVDSPEAYKIYRSDDGGDTYQYVDTVPYNQTTWRDDGPLIVGHKYWYRVRAWTEDNGASASEDKASATVSHPTSAVATLYAAGIGPGRISLLWQPPDDPQIQGYKIYRSSAPNVSPTLVAAVDDSAYRFVDSGLSAGHTYYYTIVVIGSADNDSSPSLAAPALAQNALPGVSNAGTPFTVGHDSDGDGIADVDDSDNDNDGTPDELDLDDNNNGVTDDMEPDDRDEDQDEIVDNLDPNDDNDQFDDADDDDANGNGVNDTLDPASGNLPIASISSTKRFQASFKFGGDNSAITPGYVIDIGNSFRLSSSGYRFGWVTPAGNATKGGAPFDNDVANPSLLDSGISTLHSGPVSWEVSVPNGRYYVKLVAGKDGVEAGTYRYGVEDSNTFLSGSATSGGGQWIVSTGLVNVTDNRLTIYNVAGADNHSLAYVEITDDSARRRPAIAAPIRVVAVASGPGRVDLRWKDMSDNETMFKVERAPTLTGPWKSVYTGSETHKNYVAANAGVFVDSRAAASTTYYYRVTAIKGSINSSTVSNGVTAQQQGATQTPYNPEKAAWDSGLVIQAEDFDTGGDSVAYDYDTTGGNAGGYYRASDVDIGLDVRQDRYFVGWTRPGEWMEYTVDVTETGTYVLGIAVASELRGGTFSLSIDGVIKDSSIDVPNTAAFTNYQVVYSDPINLIAGTSRVLRLQAATDGSTGYFVGDVDWLKLSKHNGGGTPGSVPRPNNLAAIGMSPGRIALVWSPDATGVAKNYDIYRSRSPYFDLDSTTYIGSIPATRYRYLDSGLSVGKQYYYCVVAKDAVNAQSLSSNIASAIGINQDNDVDNDGVANTDDDDSDNDGVIDTEDDDDDGDSILDNVDRDDSDSDNDGTPNWEDADNDNDGIADIEDEDNDNDGQVDEVDTDDNNNGTKDDEEPTDPDSDNDGIRDTVDPDDDNDGTVDSLDSDDDNDDVADSLDPDYGVTAGSRIKPTDDVDSVYRTLGFEINFYGSKFDGVYVNNNGNVTFGGALSVYTPFALLNQTPRIIAPFFADVDTRVVEDSGDDGGTVDFYTTGYNGHNAFRVDWTNVGYYAKQHDKKNSFSLIIVDRSDDKNEGDFDIVFDYQQIQWETGGASGGSGGMGGTPARAGWSSGKTISGFSAEVGGSGVSGGLIGKTGQELFEIRTANLTIDSDNDGEINRVDEEVEADVSSPGKVIAVNNDDDNNNDIIDYLEEGAERSEFADLNLTVPASAAASSMLYKLAYSASDPEDSGSSGVLRLWSKANNQFIPANEPLTASQLGVVGGVAQLMVEAVRGMSTSQEGKISLEVDVDGSGSQAEFAQADEVDTLSATIAVELKSAERGGELIQDNPNGSGNSPAFGGGFRFFPDADLKTSTVGRNRLIVRANLANITEKNVPVYFRAFDVDDPSSLAAIDPDGNGRDNRGKLNQLGSQPIASVQPGPNGYRGQLKQVGGALQAEGTVVRALTRVDGGQTYAEVELTTSYAPGDNFRVLVSLDKENLAPAKLNDTSDVPTVGAVGKLAGEASEQVAVWRRLFIEQDRMKHSIGISSLGDKKTGTAGTPVAGANGQINVPTSITLETVQENSFENGILRDSNNVNFHIVGNTSGSNAVIKLFAGSGMPAAGLITIYQDDFTADVNVRVNRLEGPITAVAAGTTAGQYVLTTGITLAANEFAGGQLFVPSTGITYSVLSNSAGANSQLTVAGSVAPTAGTGDVAIFHTLPNTVPTTRVDTEDDSHLYDMLQESVERNKNRFADAYIQPSVNVLNTYDNVTTTGQNKISSTNSEVVKYAGANATSRSKESPVFWVVHVITGFEAFGAGGTPLAGIAVDADPGGGPALNGMTDSLAKQSSIILMETIRDAYPDDKTVMNDILSRVTIHEIGHQLRLARTPNEHRASADNIMYGENMSQVPDQSFYFVADDLAYMRFEHRSPGWKQP